MKVPIDGLLVLLNHNNIYIIIFYNLSPELGQKLLYLLHHDDIDGAQVVAGRFYLSYIRRGMKIGAVLKHLSGGHDRHDHHEGPHGPTTGPYGSENHEGPPKRLDFEDFVAEDAIQDFEKGY